MRDIWITSLVNFVGILIGALFIVYQLKRQHKNSMELQAEDYRNKYRLEIYNELSQRIYDAKDITSRFLSQLLASKNEFIASLEMNEYQKDFYFVQNSQILKVLDSVNDSQNRIVGIMFLIEKYEIVIPEFRIFLTALNSISHDLINSLFKLRKVLYSYKQIDQEYMDGLEESVDSVNKHISIQMGYLYDLQIELQNKLLSKLFNNEVLKRSPKDSSVKVITTDIYKLEELKKYFDYKKNQE